MTGFSSSEGKAQVFDPVVQGVGVPYGGIPVVGVDRHLTAGVRLDLLANLPQPLLEVQKDLVLKRPETAQQNRFAADRVADGAALHPAEFQQAEEVGGQGGLQGRSRR